MECTVGLLTSTLVSFYCFSIFGLRVSAITVKQYISSAWGSEAVYPKNFHDSSDICPMDFIYSTQICKISIRHLGLVIGIVRCVRWFSWTLLKWCNCLTLIYWVQYLTEYIMLMAKCKTAVSPLLMHWRYSSLALNHGCGPFSHIIQGCSIGMQHWSTWIKSKNINQEKKILYGRQAAILKVNRLLPKDYTPHYRRTDRQTDRQTRWFQYTPLQLHWAGV